MNRKTLNRLIPSGALAAFITAVAMLGPAGASYRDAEAHRNRRPRAHDHPPDVFGRAGSQRQGGCLRDRRARPRLRP